MEKCKGYADQIIKAHTNTEQNAIAQKIQKEMEESKK